MMAIAWLIVRLYAVMVRLYPRRFRSDFGEEMQVVLADAVVEAVESGGIELVALLVCELADWPKSLLREYWSGLKGQAREVMMGQVIHGNDIPGLVPAHMGPVTRLISGITEKHPVIKRVFDITFAVVGLVVAAPLFAMLVILIKLDSPGPALFCQKRVGKDGRLFTLFKFRSMICGAEKSSAPAGGGGKGNVVDREKRDHRLTGIGRIIRTLKVDELPQLVNVLKGEMSLLGPRPELPAR